MCSEGEFRRSVLEANKVEWKVINFVIFGKGVEHGGLFREDI